MSPASLQPLALPWPKLARAALLVLPLVAHAAQACSPLQHGFPINKHKRSPGDPSEIEAVVSNVFESAPAETLPKLLADPETLVSTQPHGELPHVGALTATSGAPAQFQLAGRKRPKYPTRFGVDDSWHDLAQWSPTAAARGGSYPQEHGGGGQPANMGVPTEPASFSRDNTYFAPQRMVHVAQSSHQGFPASPTAINHAGSSSSDRGARSAPRPDNAPELTEAAHGSRPSRLPDTMSEVKLFLATPHEIWMRDKELLTSSAFKRGMSKAVHFDIGEARLDAARMVGLEADARKLLAEGFHLMELRRLLQRSMQYRKDRSKWYVVADEELRAWLERMYTLRGRISGVLKDGDYTYSIKAHVGVEWDPSVVERLRRTQQESRHRQGHSFNKQHLVGPFEMLGDVEEPFVFASYIFRLMRSGTNLPETKQIAVLPFESFFNYDPIVLKLPIVTPGILKRENLPTAIEHAGSSSSLRGAQTTPRPDDATELTKAAHGSASSHLPGTKRKVKLTKPSEDQIELAYKELSASPTILEGLTNAVHFDSDKARLAAALKAGLEDDARNLLAEGIQLMEPRRLLARSIRYSDSHSKWYVATDEELRTWLMRVYTLRERILRFPRDVKYTYSIEALEGLERNDRALGSLRSLQRNMHQRRFKEQQSLDIPLRDRVGPFEKLRAVHEPFVFASYVFQVVHQSKALAGQRQIAVLPYEPFFNYDPIVLKLPVVAPGILKVEKPPARLDQSEVS